MDYKIVETTVTPYGLRVRLANGVCFDVSSNQGYLHIGFSHIDVKKPIKLKSQYANTLYIAYMPREKD